MDKHAQTIYQLFDKLTGHQLTAHNVSMTNGFYQRQLDVIESNLRTMASSMGARCKSLTGPEMREMYNRMHFEHGVADYDEACAVWSSNIMILLRAGIIKDDEMTGLSVMSI
jgi:hypothetical protein